MIRQGVSGGRAGRASSAPVSPTAAGAPPSPLRPLPLGPRVSAEPAVRLREGMAGFIAAARRALMVRRDVTEGISVRASRRTHHRA